MNKNKSVNKIYGVNKNNIGNNNHKIIYATIAIISILAIIFSVVILIQKTSNNTPINNICSAISPSSQCAVVQNSSYGKIFGIDNPWYGIIGFAVISILATMQYHSYNALRKYIIIIGSLLAGTLAAWFLYLQQFVLHAYCVFCIFVDILSIIMLILMIYVLFNSKNNKSK